MLALRRHNERLTREVIETAYFRVPLCKPRRFPSPERFGGFERLSHMAHTRANPLSLTPFRISRSRNIPLVVEAKHPPFSRLEPLLCAQHLPSASNTRVPFCVTLKRYPYKCVADLWKNSKCF